LGLIDEHFVVGHGHQREQCHRRHRRSQWRYSCLRNGPGYTYTYSHTNTDCNSQRNTYSNACPKTYSYPQAAPGSAIPPDSAVVKTLVAGVAAAWRAELCDA